MFTLIAFDADDTLWQNETLFSAAQARVKQLLERYGSADKIDRQLYETEMRNLPYYGYGIKGFTLSLIETAIALSEGRIEGREIGRIIDLAKEMMQANVQLLDYVAETIPLLAKTYELMIVTKGDLFDQEAKIARSGLGSYFKHVEIVSDKTPAGYEAILRRYGLAPRDFLMVGNSLKSDILPVIAIGGQAVYIPHATTWVHEIIADPEQQPNGYYELEHMGQLPGLIEHMNEQKSS